ncbi:phosphotransferase family protein [Actinomadura harenae]|uniref:Aminoglycoside phosphotransferase family protein n=1 Tax=Actinomadura harenae TaxID=2483351 RepID=A0A3M2LAC3_9ACTN|nr:aminoglycoside phosphotransferase family protein [Actinomadura harenae]RMI34552.1 aminoglycoside phosphotransferase family protein [Actinomadura harenae]
MTTTNRLGWADLPAQVRDAVTEALGTRITQARGCTGGFSPGLASRLDLDDGRTVFAKAISVGRDPHAPGLYRREVQAMRQLPGAAPAPRLLWSLDDGDWVVLVLDWIPGAMPVQPWQPADLELVVRTLAEMTEILTPAPPGALPIAVDLADNYSSWRRLAAAPDTGVDRLPDWARTHLGALAALEAGWDKATGGDTLAHTDLRADNLLLTGQDDRPVMLVDWAYAVAAAPWVDLVMLLTSAAVHTSDVEQIWRSSQQARLADDAQVNALLAAMCGDYLTQSMRPAPPNIPGLRAHQRAKADAAWHWLTTRPGGAPFGAP